VITSEQEQNIDRLLELVELRKSIRRLIASLTAEGVHGEYTRAHYDISEREHRAFTAYYGFGEHQLTWDGEEVKTLTLEECASLIGYAATSGVSIAMNRYFDKIAYEEGEEFVEEMKREVEKRRKLLHF